MKISKLLPKYLPEYNFTVINEKEFQTLGLVGSDTGASKCTFIDRPEFSDALEGDVTMVITTEEISQRIESYDVGFCIVDNPRVVFFKLHNSLADIEPYARPRFKTKIGKNCKIHSSVIISDENVVIGDNVRIDPYAVIKDNVIIGDNTIIHSGVVIGDSDFEFKREGHEIFGVTHCGGVIIENDVEILANSGVNKALYPWDNTIIKKYVKIDMLCNVSHGVKIGSETMVVALSGIGGRTVIGDRCWLGYGCIIRNGITIGNDARINMGSIVTKNVENNESVTGNFAIDHDKFMEDLKRRAR
ncbi:MAG: UDP-3-O-(3-hydroxymyristoyl)glucosamine N-acyltransferase [Clostridiales bacterium]|nr:UDP-3-O-(3-hydroxymyristoyl)glucosamine N-acyltransferase [Clostridiales bacterium]